MGTQNWIHILCGSQNIKMEGRFILCNVAVDNGINESKFHLKPRVVNGFGLTMCINEHIDVAVINKSLISCYEGISWQNISAASYRSFT